jgi:hypothetical protein
MHHGPTHDAGRLCRRARVLHAHPTEQEEEGINDVELRSDKYRSWLHMLKSVVVIQLLDSQ